MQPLVSVIVTTKNSASILQTCLESIRNQTYLRKELIVVDNHSTDKTREIASFFTTKLYVKGPERSVQRNFGASIATGEYLFFIDSDMELTPRVIEECIQISTKEQLGALYVPEIIAGDTLWSRVRTFERSFYNATPIDAVRFIRKNLFNKVKGFDESLTGPEDWDLDKRIRAVDTVGIIQSPIIHHEEQTTLATYVQKKMYYARDMSKYVRKWSVNDTDVKKQLGFWYRYIQVYIEDGKWRKLLSNPFLTFLMLSVRFLIGALYLLHYPRKW